jgi:hypothetical protein
MKGMDRRRFLAMSSSVSIPFFTDLDFLAPLSRLACAATTFDPSTVDRNAKASHDPHDFKYPASLRRRFCRKR